jgi:hypothetical protein
MYGPKDAPSQGLSARQARVAKARHDYFMAKRKKRGPTSYYSGGPKRGAVPDAGR